MNESTITIFVKLNSCWQEMMNLYFDKKKIICKKKNFKVTEMTNKNSRKVTESVNDIEWIDKQMCNVLNNTKQKFDIFAFITKLLDNDKTVINNMWWILTANHLHMKQSQLHVMWNQSEILCNENESESTMSVIECDNNNNASNNEK